ncbi:MAG: fasciclin domain-containing protein [Microthrixaceae bacterium]|nr:fasciclin domain-containing protein [Microthrixaceae bacterium]
MKQFRYSLVAVLAGVALIGAACSDDDADSESSTTTEAEETTTTEAASSDDAGSEDPGTIVDIAAGNEDFSTLVTAVTEAGLVETLSGEGPYTVFAPTNAAFDALPEGTLDSLLEDPSGALTEILQLHVIAGEVDSAAAAAAVGTCVETLGGEVKVEEVDGGLTIGGAPISTTDLEASNGIIHVIDAVIVEPSTDC